MFDLSGEKFLLLKSIKSILVKCDTLLLNIPKSDLDYKFRLRDSLEKAYKLIVTMNHTKNEKDFTKLHAALCAEVSYINFSLEIIYDKKYINSKNLNDLFKYINEFNKMLFSWYNKKIEKFENKN